MPITPSTAASTLSRGDGFNTIIPADCGSRHSGVQGRVACESWRQRVQTLSNKMKAHLLLALLCSIFFGCERQDPKSVNEKPEKEYSKEVLEIADRISYEPEAVAKVRSLPA